MSRFYDALKKAGEPLPVPLPEEQPEDFAHLSAGTLKDFFDTLQEPAATPVTAAAISELVESAVPTPIEPPVAPPPDAVAPDPFIEPANGQLSAQGNGRLHTKVDATPSAPAKFGTLVHVDVNPRSGLLLDAPEFQSVESYRLLRTEIAQRQAEKMFRTLLVTSPSPQEGKTLTVFNLALIFAMLPSFRVLMIDGDIRRGSLGQRLGLDEQVGLSNLIEGTATLDEVVLHSPDFPVSFMVRGTSKLSPAELLHTGRCKSYFQEAARHFDLVIVDSPPTNLVADVPLLAAACDAVLIVARAFSTSQKALEETRKRLRGFPVIGTILNAKPTRAHPHKYHPYYGGR